LGDAIRGDAMLFVRQDSVEAAWAVVDPVLNVPTPCCTYEAGSWGPAEADTLIAPNADGDGGWRNPDPADC
jgi:glucose-6-phosphate 1-dehydrogenase